MFIINPFWVMYGSTIYSKMRVMYKWVVQFNNIRIWSYVVITRQRTCSSRWTLISRRRTSLTLISSSDNTISPLSTNNKFARGNCLRSPNESLHPELRIRPEKEILLLLHRYIFTHKLFFLFYSIINFVLASNNQLYILNYIMKTHLEKIK